MYNTDSDVNILQLIETVGDFAKSLNKRGQMDVTALDFFKESHIDGSYINSSIMGFVALFYDGYNTVLKIAHNKL